MTVGINTTCYRTYQQYKQKSGEDYTGRQRTEEVEQGKILQMFLQNFDNKQLKHNFGHVPVYV